MSGLHVGYLRLFTSKVTSRNRAVTLRGVPNVLVIRQRPQFGQTRGVPALVCYIDRDAQGCQGKDLEANAWT